MDNSDVSEAWYDGREEGRRESKAEKDELKADLAEAYKELRQQRPTIRAVFNRAVWDKAQEGE